MPRIVKLFRNGRSQAVRLPREFRFDGVKEVSIRKDPASGDVILSARPDFSWNDWFRQLDRIPLKEREEFADFMLNLKDLPLKPGDRDPFKGWKE